MCGRESYTAETIDIYVGVHETGDVCVSVRDRESVYGLCY